MIKYTCILMVTFAFVSTKGDALFDPCSTDDLKCLSSATETFMSKTYGGVPEWGIKPVDPLIISSLHIDTDKVMGLEFHFTNLSITGMKKVKITDFKIDMIEHTALLQMKADVTITGNINILLSRFNKSFNGDYTAKTSVIGTSKYPTTLKKVNSTDYFVVGPEKTKCHIPENPEVTLGTELQTALDKDPDALNMKPEWESRQVDLRKLMLCEMAQEVFRTIIHNIRASAEILPKNAFFNNI